MNTIAGSEPRRPFLLVIGDFLNANLHEYTQSVNNFVGVPQLRLWNMDDRVLNGTTI